MVLTLVENGEFDMETTTKLAIGVSALCCLATAAFAGGPDVPTPDMSGFHIGLGGGYNSYTWDQVASVTNGVETLSHPSSVALTQFAPVGELGYTFANQNWIFGVRVKYQYDNVRVVEPGFVIEDEDLDYRTRLGSQLSATLLAGLKVNSFNAVYLEGGYTTLWDRVSFPIATSAEFPYKSVKARLNGGVAAIGWRHYFMNNVFFDVRYSYSMYKNKTSGVSTTSEYGLTATVNNPARLVVKGITVTANYLFNM